MGSVGICLLSNDRLWLPLANYSWCTLFFPWLYLVLNVTLSIKLFLYWHVQMLISCTQTDSHLILLSIPHLWILCCHKYFLFLILIYTESLSIFFVTKFVQALSFIHTNLYKDKETHTDRHTLHSSFPFHLFLIYLAGICCIFCLLSQFILKWNWNLWLSCSG